MGTTSFQDPKKPIFPGGNFPSVTNADGSRSNVLTTTVEFDGTTFVLPTMVGGRELSVDGAVKYARKHGLNKFPSFKDAGEAEKYSKSIHARIDSKGFLIPANAMGIATKTSPNSNMADSLGKLFTAAGLGATDVVLGKDQLGRFLDRQALVSEKADKARDKEERLAIMRAGLLGQGIDIADDASEVQMTHALSAYKKTKEDQAAAADSASLIAKSLDDQMTNTLMRGDITLSDFDAAGAGVMGNLSQLTELMPQMDETQRVAYQNRINSYPDRISKLRGNLLVTEFGRSVAVDKSAVLGIGSLDEPLKQAALKTESVAGEVGRVTGNMGLVLGMEPGILGEFESAALQRDIRALGTKLRDGEGNFLYQDGQDILLNDPELFAELQALPSSEVVTQTKRSQFILGEFNPSVTQLQQQFDALPGVVRDEIFDESFPANASQHLAVTPSADGYTITGVPDFKTRFIKKLEAGDFTKDKLNSIAEYTRTVGASSLLSGLQDNIDNARLDIARAEHEDGGDVAADRIQARVDVVTDGLGEVFSEGDVQLLQAHTTLTAVRDNMVAKSSHANPFTNPGTTNYLGTPAFRNVDTSIKNIERMMSENREGKVTGYLGLTTPNYDESDRLEGQILELQRHQKYLTGKDPVLGFGLDMDIAHTQELYRDQIRRNTFGQPVVRVANALTSTTNLSNFVDEMITPTGETPVTSTFDFEAKLKEYKTADNPRQIEGEIIAALAPFIVAKTPQDGELKLGVADFMALWGEHSDIAYSSQMSGSLPNMRVEGFAGNTKWSDNQADRWLALKLIREGE